MLDTKHKTVTEQYILDHFDEALERHYIDAYCQPVIRAASGQICGLEALARWVDPELGVLTPDKFIGVLEHHRRIHELDGYIVRQVCERLPDTESEMFVPVSVNLSRLDYELCDIFEVVEEAVRTNKVPRSQICIEITESVLGANDELMRGYIRRFQKAGYQVWMDDFGSGYSSLNVLKDYRFDELKIDMEFLSDFGPRSKTILASIVNMAKQIGIQTLTEGVETEEQFAFLRNIGCEKVQGNLFGPAMPYSEVRSFAKARGMAWEAPRHRKYYDDMGRINLLSATPFHTAADREDPGTGREMNSIPLSVIELHGEEGSFLYANEAFERTIAGADWKMGQDAEQNPIYGGVNIPLARLSASVRRLLEETRKAGKGRLNFVHNGEYYEIRTKRLASYDDRCSMLARIVNLSRGAELARQSALDEGLRQIYAIYDRVSIIDTINDCAEPLYLDSREEEEEEKQHLTIREATQRYAAEWIFPEDRERYLRFVDADTLSYRVDLLSDGSITSYFRTLGSHGAYSWKCYTVVRVRQGIYYGLVRDTEAEIRELESYYGNSGEGSNNVDDGFPTSLLWENVKRNSPLKFFWKDKDRRFLGASQSFLDFYGFSSLADILGKTDEDMGWHLHPEDYRESELHVINEGVTSRNRPGTCIVHGENRSIVASKMPVYNANGDIIGLIGYFSAAEGEAVNGRQTPPDVRLDKLTGLLNTRGVDEGMYAFRDEYELRHTDFARIEVSVEELSDINRRYGYDFGDSLLRAVANALLRCCGNTSMIGRMTGSEFVIFTQIHEDTDVNKLIERIRAISSETQTVEGMPFTTYLSVGAAAYSETESLDKQAVQAQLRRMTEDVGNIPVRHLRENMARMFFPYDALPLAYAVYKIVGEGEDIDAVILYVNQKYTKIVERTSEELVGARVSRLFPMNTGAWMEVARRAAAGEETSRNAYYAPYGFHMNMTASQVIGEGYCAFTYQVVERP